MVPWQYTELWKQITAALDLPTLTGEDIYLKEPFAELCRNHAVDLIHPDLATAGGLLETKKIGDMAMEYGVGMAMHFAGTPVSFFANVHCAAATENFLVLEHHSFASPPSAPGLGFQLNEEVVRQHLAPGTGQFEKTDTWDSERSWDRLYS
jgi:L-alanine-DL-glutamate epimerase-like enolase superfamily enzyme